MKLLELLYNHEKKYVEEIDRIEKNSEEVLFIEGKNDSGWICLKAPQNSFDWNITRLIGNIDDAKEALSKIPFDESVILIDEGLDLSESSNIKRNNSLYFYENSVICDSNSYDYDLNNYLNSSDIYLPKGSIKQKASSLNSRIDDLYLIMKNLICGYIKVIKSTWHYSELAIEINPEYRNQGFGTALMDIMNTQFSLKSQKFIYVVESDNIPSIKLANKFLRKSFVLDKYVYKK